MQETHTSRTVPTAFVAVLGHIWQPGFSYCSMVYELTASDLATIGQFNPANVRSWLDTHSGDFQSLTDFCASNGVDGIDWADEYSETLFQDTLDDHES